MNQEQYEAAKATLEEELSKATDERMQQRLQAALDELPSKLVIEDATE